MSNEELEEQIQNIIKNCAPKNEIKRENKLNNALKKWCNINLNIDSFVIAILFVSFSVSIYVMGYVTEKIETPFYQLVGIGGCLLIILIPLILISIKKQKDRIKLDYNDEIRMLLQQISEENIKYLKEDIHWTIDVVNVTVFQIILVGCVMTLFTQILTIVKGCTDFSFLNCIILSSVIFFIFLIAFFVIVF